MFGKAAAVVLLALTLSLAAQADAGPLRRAGLVDVRAGSPQVRIDMRYATERNFTGRRLPGYCEQRALLLRRPARALRRVERALSERGLGLLVLDAYRPARATRAMVRWARREGREDLLDGYIARRSRHNLGAAVDLTLVEAGSGDPLSMGTAYDSFSTRSHTRNAKGRALENRLRLKRAMEREGFENYRREWWHYDFPGGKRRLDLPIGC